MCYFRLTARETKKHLVFVVVSSRKPFRRLERLLIKIALTNCCLFIFQSIYLRTKIIKVFVITLLQWKILTFDVYPINLKTTSLPYSKLSGLIGLC